ncbi:peptidase C12 ubiquitin carboxyl-terminal hydrolase 1 [Amylostereum chailletii]|nr:peptidase C12 ubiquitin carboxyl-terminal hydrolase 1 [Amylostereum chailletii]
MSNPRWIPLESNPEVMNSWAFNVGLLPSDAQFVDVYGLDEELLAMVPQPVHAVVLLFPIRGEIESASDAEEAKFAIEGRPEVDPTIFWMKQTIGNACGTMGLIHALANSNVVFEPESIFQRLIDVCKDKSPLERAKVLETTDLLANVHAEAASSGQTAAPDVDFKTDLHFTCFVEAPSAATRLNQTGETEMRMVELDGRRAGPVDRGACTDLLRDAARYIKENMVPKMSSSLELSMCALAAPEK